MAEQTGISWADATFNPWIGCTKVSPACDRCYAARDNERWHWVSGWGAGAERRRTAPANWNNVRKWDRKAALAGRPLKLFCASLADVFDNEVPQLWRNDLWRLVRETQNIRWMFVTKRIGNAESMLPLDWPFPNAGLMATLADQKEWDRDFRKLVDVPAAWHGVSAEPLLGRIDCRGFGAVTNGGEARIQWMITGGESGEGFRPLNMDWVRDIRDQCAFWKVTFHHKQNGGVRGKDAGCLVDGVEHKHFPEALAA